MVIRSRRDGCWFVRILDVNHYTFFVPLSSFFGAPDDYFHSPSVEQCTLQRTTAAYDLFSYSILFYCILFLLYGRTIHIYYPTIYSLVSPNIYIYIFFSIIYLLCFFFWKSHIFSFCSVLKDFNIFCGFCWSLFPFCFCFRLSLQYLYIIFHTFYV